MGGSGIVRSAGATLVEAAVGWAAGLGTSPAGAGSAARARAFSDGMQA